jgi:hypothetical protein
MRKILQRLKDWNAICISQNAKQIRHYANTFLFKTSFLFLES